MTILATSVRCGQNTLEKTLKEEQFISLHLREFGPWLFDPMHLSRMSSYWMYMMGGRGRFWKTKSKEQGRDYKQGKKLQTCPTQTYANVTLPSTKSHILKFLPLLKIVPLAQDQVLTY